MPNNNKAPKKSQGSKKAKGGVNIRQATSSLKAYQPKNVDGPVRSVPAAMGSMKVTGKPRISAGTAGDSRIVHREYLADVNMAASFGSATFPMNPGVSRTFPWLSTIAARYESYRFNRLRFCFETSCSSTQTGSVLLIPDYDAKDLPPVSKTQALAYRNSARGQAWLSFCQESAQEDLHKLKSRYIRAGSIPSGSDLLLYDVGNLFLCVQGSDTNVVGELWVEYDVLLMTPQINGQVISELVTAGGTISKAAVFGTAPVFVGSLDATISVNTIQFNAAYEGLVVLLAGGTGLVAPTLTGSATKAANLPGLGTSGTATAQYTVFIVQAQPGQTVILDYSGSTTVTSLYMRIGAYTYANQ